MSALPIHVVPSSRESQAPSEQPRGPLARLLRLHIRDVAVWGVIMAIFTMALKPVVDNDVFWHLATGRYMWATGRIPHADPFSWTALGRAWIAHEWLTEAWLYPLYTHGGYAALMLLFAAMIAAAFAFAYATARRLGASRPFGLGITALAAVASDHTWGVRPQMISMLLMALTAWLLTRELAPRPITVSNVERDDAGTAAEVRVRGAMRPRLEWALPALMVFWVNTHGGFIFGLALIGLVALGQSCEAWWSRAAAARAAALRLWRLLALCIAVCLLNPNGLKGVIYPFTYLGNNASTRYIAEWVSPDFHQFQYQLFEALLLFLIVGAALSPRRPRVGEVLLSLAFTYLALDSVRNINLFAVIVAPLVAVYLSFAWRGLRASRPRLTPQPPLPQGARGRATPHPPTPSPSGGEGEQNLVSPLSREGEGQGARGHVTPTKGALNLALVVVVAVAALWLSAPGLSYAHNVKMQARRFPAGAVAYLRTHHPIRPLLNSYDWGGYLIWQLYPRVRVYVDGRPDMYGDRFMDAFVRTWQAKPGWQTTLRRQGVRLVLVEPSSGLGHALATAPGWRLIYHDSLSVLYERGS